VIDPAAGGADDEESDDDVGPMPMPAGAEGVVAKKRKGTSLPLLLLAKSALTYAFPQF
jgi:hypothetical protein